MEQFEVVSSGSLFAAFAPIEDYPVFAHIGHEYRELLTAQVEEHTDLQCIAIGPTPIHLKFYFVFGRKESGRPSPRPRIYSEQNDVFIVLHKDKLANRDVAAGFLRNVESPVESFYSLHLSREYGLMLETEISSHFYDVAQCVESIAQVPWWNIPKLARSARLERTGLVWIHRRAVELETELLTWRKARRDFLRNVAENIFLSHGRDYFQEQTEPYAEIPQTFPQAVGHFREELSTFKNTRSIVIASLVGAAIGAGLTALLTPRP